MSAFSNIESAYEKFGAEEPFYAVLTEEKYKRKQLDEELFFKTGEDLLARQMKLIQDRGIQISRGRALDFGCGVGRLTNAMATYFDEVIDVTIPHIPSPESENYIRDFFRVLAPGGVAIFLVPDGPVLRPNSLPARFEKFYCEQVRPFHKRIRGKYEVQVHRISQQRVETIIRESNADLLSVEPHPRWAERTKKYKPLYYWASKPND